MVAPDAARPVAAALSSWAARVGGSDAGPIPTTPNFAPDPAVAGDDAGDAGGDADDLALGGATVLGAAGELGGGGEGANEGGG